MPIAVEQVIEALRPVHDPELHRSIVDLGMVRDVEVSLTDLHHVWSEALAAGAVTPDEYRRAVLGLEPLGTANAVDELLQPSAAGATPADQPTPDVITLRPNTWAVN